MNLTAVVLNAGLGDLSLGLQMAGFRVAAAYEEDMKAREVHAPNIDTPVSPSPPYDMELLEKSADRHWQGSPQNDSS